MLQLVFIYFTFLCLFFYSLRVVVIGNSKAFRAFISIFVCILYTFETKIIAAYGPALSFDCCPAECTAAFGNWIGRVVTAPLIDIKPHALKCDLAAHEEDASGAQIQLSSEWRWCGASGFGQ